MKIISLYKPKYYLVTHYKCCTFIANENEVKIVNGQYNESCINCICPHCGKEIKYADIVECNKYGERKNSFY